MWLLKKILKLKLIIRNKQKRAVAYWQEKHTLLSVWFAELLLTLQRVKLCSVKEEYFCLEDKYEQNAVFASRFDGLVFYSWQGLSN